MKKKHFHLWHFYKNLFDHNKSYYEICLHVSLFLYADYPPFHIYPSLWYKVTSVQGGKELFLKQLLTQEEIISSIALREIAENLHGFADKLLRHPLFLFCTKR